MTFYRLHRASDESSGEGEDWSEWFTALTDAKKRRSALIQENPYGKGLRYMADYQIDRVGLLKLPPKALMLALLNRAGYVNYAQRVVLPYVFPPEPPEEED